MDISDELYRMKDSFLFAASQGGRVEECLSLVDLGADVNFFSGGESVLSIAVKQGHLDVVELLAANGVSINEKVTTMKPSPLSSEGEERVQTTPLHLAVGNGDLPLTQLLLSCGGDFNQV